MSKPVYFEQKDTITHHMQSTTLFTDFKFKNLPPALKRLHPWTAEAFRPKVSKQAIP